MIKRFSCVVMNLFNYHIINDSFKNRQKLQSSGVIFDNGGLIMSHSFCLPLQICQGEQQSIWQRYTQSQTSTFLGFPHNDYCIIRSRGKPRNLLASLCVFQLFLHIILDRQIWSRIVVFRGRCDTHLNALLCNTLKQQPIWSEWDLTQCNGPRMTGWLCPIICKECYTFGAAPPIPGTSTSAGRKLPFTKSALSMTSTSMVWNTTYLYTQLLRCFGIVLFVLHFNKTTL